MRDQAKYKCIRLPPPSLVKAASINRGAGLVLTDAGGLAAEQRGAVQISWAIGASAVGDKWDDVNNVLTRQIGKFQRAMQRVSTYGRAWRGDAAHRSVRSMFR
jgi:hypothetical protein